MNERRTVTVDRGWNLLLHDLGIDAQSALRRSGLPQDLLGRESAQLTVEEYIALVEAVDTEANDPMLAIRMGQGMSAEAFSPPIFAALCSSTMAVAVQRIAAHKRLIAPMSLVYRDSPQGLHVQWTWDDPTVRSPRLLMAMELVFLTQLGRIGTRAHIRPVHVSCPRPLEPRAAYEEFFGVAPVVDAGPSLTFAHADAQRPFLTASEALWRSFEPELRRRVSKLEAQAATADRVQSVLLECLPGGEASIEGAAKRLGLSRRTLQRRLGEEGVTFRQIVKNIRERLARHYLLQTSLPYEEVAFLLGFDEPTSFFRAFREWTGQTPETVRIAGGGVPQPAH
ncbi:MAG: AraC family transcriptional regulator [Deltaproteobacteria bacterium]|nr:AraC family transcriptional regulator [Deltaproteobacteria bacterium]